MTKTAGIVCDAYKLEGFKEALDKNHFVPYTVKDGPGKNVKTIKVTFHSRRTYELKALIENTEREIKANKK